MARTASAKRGARGSRGADASLASVLGGLGSQVKGTKVRKPSFIPPNGLHCVRYTGLTTKTMMDKNTGDEYTLFIVNFVVEEGDDAGREFAVLQDSKGIIVTDKETGDEVDFFPGILFIKTLGSFIAQIFGEDTDIVDDENELARLLEEGGASGDVKIMLEVGESKSAKTGKTYPRWTLKRPA